MLVLHVSPTYYSPESVIGGGERYLLYMIKALNKEATNSSLKLQNEILSFSDTESGDYCVQENVYHIIGGKPWDTSTIDLESLCKYLRLADVIIVHQCFCPVGLFVASHAQLLKKYVIGMDHGGGDHPIVSHSPESKLIFNLFLAQSDYSAAAFRNSKVPTLITYGPVDTDYFTCSSDTPRERGLVLSVGRILPHKGFDRIISALPRDLHIVIAGNNKDQKYLEYLKNIASKRNISIKILEELTDSDIRLYMQKASLYVHASTHIDYCGNIHTKPELLGLAPLEALACGTPTFVSDAGSLAELGKIDGCYVFHSDKELIELFEHFILKKLSIPSPEKIHLSVDKYYGLTSFGRLIINHLRNALNK